MAKKYCTGNPKPMPSQDELNRAFEYRDGELFYKTTTATNKKIGDRAGTCRKTDKYSNCSIGTGKFYTHRIIFMMHHGYCPEMVDHIDQDPKNNRIENLRACTGTQNQFNRGLQSNNKSGVKGVRFCTKTNRWTANIGYMGKRIWLGYFDKKEDAGDAYQNKYKQLMGVTI